mgnify:CR=1 FL=1
MSTKPRRPAEKRKRLLDPISIRLPAELYAHLKRIEETIKDNDDLKRMLHHAPNRLANLTQKQSTGRDLKTQIIEFLIINHINDFTRTFTPNIEPFHPYDDAESAVNLNHAHMLNRDRSLIEQAIIDDPDILDMLPKDPRELPDENYIEIGYYAYFIRSYKAPNDR